MFKGARASGVPFGGHRVYLGHAPASDSFIEGGTQRQRATYGPPLCRQAKKKKEGKKIVRARGKDGEEKNRARGEER